MRATRRITIAILSAFAVGGYAAPDPLAVAFGTLPDSYRARLAPSGEYVSYLSMTDFDLPVVYVADATGESQLVLASKKDAFDAYWCGWANEERLLCGFYGVHHQFSDMFPETRLVAVNRDSSDMKVLLQKRLQREWGIEQFHDDIMDWLPDDPEHVLLEMPSDKGTGVSRVNIYSGRIHLERRVRESAREWISDGHGEPRVRMIMTSSRIEWQYRDPDGAEWKSLFDYGPEDDVEFVPLGFGDDRNHLLVAREYDNRLALWSQDLTGNEEDKLVFAHSAVDVSHLLRLGKYRRLAGIGYAVDQPVVHYFDPSVAGIIASVSEAKPGMHVEVVDESWDRKVYLLRMDSPSDPGRYYKLDLRANQLVAFWPNYPLLEDRELAQMEKSPYRARDGVEIPAYLTLPPDKSAAKLPMVLLPHGGPESRDYLAFDFLVQFLAARGYAVLQPNYRGSGGYGNEWAGEGGFRNWRQVIDDLTDGSRHLIDEGIVDPDRICAVGWSYGGYAALMSVIEEPDLYRCAVSIAGVTDPMALIQDSRGFLNRKWVREFVGTEDDIINAGSPVRRADEITVPVLLFHGDEDMNVNLEHSKDMHRSLKKARKSTELVVYDDAEHAIRRNEYRIDMLDRIGAFLDENTQRAADSTAAN